MSPTLLFWCDLETTGLDPREDHVLELAYVLTDFKHPYREVRRGHFLISGPSTRDLIEGRCSEFIQTMHEVSGLRAALAEAEKAEKTVALPKVEAALLALSQDWSTEKNEKIPIAGFTAHFDLSFLRAHFPTFAKRLSHRVFDASNLKMTCLSLGMPEGEKKEADHRAEADVDASIRLAREYIAWLTGGPASRAETASRVRRYAKDSYAFGVPEADHLREAATILETADGVGARAAHRRSTTSHDD